MINQKTDESIDEIDRETLFEYIETKEFLAVVWCESLYLNILFLLFFKGTISFYNQEEGFLNLNSIKGCITKVKVVETNSKL